MKKCFFPFVSLVLKIKYRLGKADSPQHYIDDTIRAGGGLNDRQLVEVMAEHAAQRALDFERYGVKYIKEDGEIRLWKSADCTFVRALPGGVPYSGDWFQWLVQETQRLNIEAMDHFAVMHLIKDGNTVTGSSGTQCHRFNSKTRTVPNRR